MICNRQLSFNRFYSINTNINVSIKNVLRNLRLEYETYFLSPILISLKCLIRSLLVIFKSKQPCRLR